MSQNSRQSRIFVSFILALALVACLFAGEAMAGGKGNKGGGDDIILYNGNIVVRGSGGKGKGKGGSGGSIVVANTQPHDHSVEMMPPMFDMWGGMGRRR